MRMRGSVPSSLRRFLPFVPPCLRASPPICHPPRFTLSFRSCRRWKAWTSNPSPIAYKALGDSVRLRILQLLPRSAAVCDDLYCVCELSHELGIPQPTVSHHLKILKQAGIVRSVKKCSSVYYYIDAPRLRQAWRDLKSSVLRT